MRPTAVLASALVRLATVLTAAVPGGYGGGDGDGDQRGGDGDGDGGGKRGGDGGGEGEGEGEGGGAGQVETVPETPPVRVVGQEQAAPLPLTQTFCPPSAVLPLMVHDAMATVPPST